MKNRIRITFDCFTLENVSVRNIIRTCIEKTLLMEGVGIPCEINVLVTNDKGIQCINQASRNIDKPTDVLSFPMFQFVPGELPQDFTEYIDPETEQCPLGDMAISLERAKAQAQEFGHSVRREIGYLTIHSVLHLLGYDHLDEGPQKAQMRAREEEIALSIPKMTR